MTTLFPDFMDTALLRRIAEGDVEALQESVDALDKKIAAAQAEQAELAIQPPAAPKTDG